MDGDDDLTVHAFRQCAQERRELSRMHVIHRRDWIVEYAGVACRGIGFPDIYGGLRTADRLVEGMIAFIVDRINPRAISGLNTCELDPRLREERDRDHATGGLGIGGIKHRARRGDRICVRARCLGRQRVRLQSGPDPPRYRRRDIGFRRINDIR